MEVDIMSTNNSLVATYANHSVAKDTLRKLESAGFDMHKLFVVTRDQEPSLSGITVVNALSDIGEEQFSCIPVEYIPNYEAELKVDRVLLVAHGTPEEIDRARSVIDSTHPDGWDGSVGCAVYYGCND